MKFQVAFKGFQQIERILEHVPRSRFIVATLKG